MSVSEERVSQALKYLVETDESCAMAKALMKGLDSQIKTIEAIEFMKNTGALGQREKMARASQAYRDHLAKLQDAVFDYETLNNKRNTEGMVIKVFRSLNANRRKGNI